ncbi:MAG TPA: adenosylcobinamide-phosphate synthase CbiB [Telluria sp.]|nr:adenosylcobinamide-phosphate synthase CbiB [Telluria sp.]
MLAGLSASMMVLLLATGVGLDLLLGETRRWHPLVGFGRWAAAIERWLNCGRHRFARGVLAWALAVAPLTALAAQLAYPFWHAALLYICLGLRSLEEHNLPIAQALRGGDLALARRLTARIVSRDTEQATPGDLAKASTESVLENGNDAVFGALFWFAIAGGPGVLAFRLANTLDAMWGYRTPRYQAFGWAAARIDDVLNFIPARLTAASYVLLSDDRRRAWRCWRTQAPGWTSPNAGPVMASGAGALGLTLGGAATYEGVLEQRPPLGQGRAAGADDIGRAWRLVLSVTWLWLGLLAACAGACYLIGAAHA